MSSIEFIPVKTTGAAGYTPVNDSYQTTTSSKQSEVLCFNKKTKKTTALYFSAGTSNNKSEIACQFNDRLLTTTLKERGIKRENLFKLFDISVSRTPDHVKNAMQDSNADLSCKEEHLNLDLTYHNPIIRLDFPKGLKKYILADTKETITNLNLLDVTNIEELEASIDENNETSNHLVFEQIVKMIRGNLKVTDAKSFPYKNILSLADGKSFLEGTAIKIKEATHDIKNNLKITSADLASTDRSRIYIESNGTNTLFTSKDIKDLYQIEIINLDNIIPFTAQEPAQGKKYDLVVMDKGLCMCYEDFACGGVIPSQKGSLYNLLTNVASILDTTKPHSLAVLTGSNSDYSIELWDADIKQFNTDNQQLVAETVRDRAGIFHGIIIKGKDDIINPITPDSKSYYGCSIL